MNVGVIGLGLIGGSIALKIKEISGYKGKIVFNKKYPDGVVERKLDISK